MRLKPLFACGCVALAVAACSKDTDGELTQQDPLAAVRYVNLVSDTTALDFRIIDIVGDAPNTVAATFRTGGAPNGVTNTVPTQPPHLPVRAGTRQIRVFLNGSTPAVASTIVLDTQVTFEANSNYTFFLTGLAAGGAPALTALLVKDSVPTIPTGQFALRVINLAPSLSSAVNQPANVASPLDITVSASDGPVPAAGAPTFANLPYGAISNYVMLPTSTPAAGLLRITATPSGSTSPLLIAGILPNGATSATANPIAGTFVAGTAITAVIVPRSAPGTGAPQTVPANVTTNIDSITRAGDVVTVWRAITAGNGTSTCNTAVAAGAAVGDVIVVPGLTDAAYNGQHIVTSVTAGTSQTAVAGPPFSCTGTATPSRFTYRIAGTPVSPAAGTRSFRVIGSGTNRALDFSVPSVIYLIDQQPPRTQP